MNSPERTCKQCGRPIPPEARQDHGPQCRSKSTAECYRMEECSSPFSRSLQKAAWMCLQILCGLLAWIDAPAATHYVWQDSPNPTVPFTNWATGAHTIQEAVDAAQAGDTVLVTNGVYSPFSIYPPHYPLERQRSYRHHRQRRWHQWVCYTLIRRLYQRVHPDQRSRR